MGQTMSSRVSSWIAKCLLQAFILSPFVWGESNQASVVAASTHNTQLKLDDVLYTTHSVLTQTDWWHVMHVIVRIIVILTISYFFMRLIDKIIHTWGPKISGARAINSHSAVINTVLPIIRSVLRWILGLMTLLLLLSELGVNITPLIYSLSVIGLAVSIGSQNLVKDFINGIMALVEGTMAVGDEVIIGNLKGIVESMSLRYVYLKHEAGALHTIPFSEVTTITNVSRDYSKVTLSLICTPAVSLDVLGQIFEEAYNDIKSSEKWQHTLPFPIEFQGVKRVTAQGVEVVAQIKTKNTHVKSLTYALYNKVLPLCQERGVPLVSGVSDPDTHTNQYVVY